MAEIKKVTKQTENPYVNLYELDTTNRKGNPGKYYVASLELIHCKCISSKG